MRQRGQNQPAVTVRAKPGDAQKAIVTCAGRSFQAAIGRSGISALKREGDGATPLATMVALEGYWRADRLAKPVTRLPLRPISTAMGWCDAPWHASYNRLITLPFSASHEQMRRDDSLYDLVLVIDWNVRRRKAGAGSAIFMHLARPGRRPTEGCIALEKRDMLWLLRVLGRSSRIIVTR